MDYRIVKTDAIKAALKKERFQGSEDPGADISRFWGECTSDGTARALCEHIEPNSAFGGALLGVCYSDPKEGDYDYAIGAAYTGGEPQNGLVVEEIPANTWAVFKCVGPMPDAFTNLCRQIYTEFFPTSEYQPSGEMCIEVYFGDDVTSENYACEYWISVRKR